MQRDTRRAQQAEKVKAEILDAAIPLFARGYDSVAVQDIAAAAGHKHSLVMYHFGTKDQLWERAAQHLMARFERLHRHHFDRCATPQDDRQKLQRLLLAFVLALRDLPAYGQVLLSEGALPSERLLWLHQHYFPSAFVDTRFDDPRLEQALKQVSLQRNALVGALLYSVVAAPQIALSAQQDGIATAAQSYPLSDALAAGLVEMMTAFFLDNLDTPPARPSRRPRSTPAPKKTRR